MRYLPMSFDTKNKTVLIIGGDSVALNRIRRLLESEFKIYVIAKDFIDEIITLSNKFEDRVKIKEGEVTKDFVFFGYDYLILATNDILLNQSLEERAIKSNIPYERCDIVSSSSLLMNRVISKEGLTVGITTNGINPTITDIVYEDIYNLLENYNEEKILILNKIRRELIKKNALNIDTTIRELFETEKINLNTYLKNLEDEDDSINEDLKKEIIEEKINEIKKEINTESEDAIENISKDIKSDEVDIDEKILEEPIVESKLSYDLPVKKKEYDDFVFDDEKDI